jgi:hypothetical protein
MELAGRRRARLMRGDEGHPQQGRSPRGAGSGIPSEAQGAVADYRPGLKARVRRALVTVLARQDMGGLGPMVGRRGVSRSQG